MTPWRILVLLPLVLFIGIACSNSDSIPAPAAPMVSAAELPDDAWDTEVAQDKPQQEARGPVGPRGPMGSRGPEGAAGPKGARGEKRPRPETKDLPAPRVPKAPGVPKAERATTVNRPILPWRPRIVPLAASSPALIGEAESFVAVA